MIDEILECLGFWFSTAENQAVETWLGDDDRFLRSTMGVTNNDPRSLILPSKLLSFRLLRIHLHPPRTNSETASPTIAAKNHHINRG